MHTLLQKKKKRKEIHAHSSPKKRKEKKYMDTAVDQTQMQTFI